MFVYKPLIRSNETTEGDVTVVDRYRIAFPQKGFDQFHQGTFPQIIRIRFERHSQESHTFFAKIEDLLNPKLHLRTIALKNRVEHGALDVKRFGLIGQCTKILREARSPESKSRLQIGRRKIQINIRAEDRHDLVTIDSHLLAEVPHFIGKSDLQRMKCVVGILRHLCRSNRRTKDRGLDPLVQLEQEIADSFIVLSDDDPGRLKEIMNRRPFAEEFRIVTHSEFFSSSLA